VIVGVALWSRPRLGLLERRGRCLRRERRAAANDDRHQRHGSEHQDEPGD
jgi:hypothetical protein